MKEARLQGMLLMLSCTALWSFQGVLTKLIPWNPIALAGWRGLFSGLVLFLYMRVKGMGLVRSRRSFAIGFCSFMAAWSCVAGHSLTTSANTVMLQYTSPVFFMLLSALIYKRRFRPLDYGVVGIVILGTVLFFMDELSPGNIWGNLSALLCGLTYGGMFLFTGEAEPQERLSGILIGAALTFLCCAPFPLSWANAGLILLMGALFHGLPYVLYCRSFQHCPPMAAVLISTAEIILNPLWVLLIVGERPGFYACVGSIVILSTVTAYNAADSRRGKPAAREEA